MKLLVNFIGAVMLLSLGYVLPISAQVRSNHGPTATQDFETRIGRHLFDFKDPSSSNDTSDVAAQDCTKNPQDPMICSILVEIRNSLTNVDTNTKATTTALNSVVAALNNLNARLAEIKSSTDNTSRLIDQQVQQANQLLYDAIAKRFDALPGALLTNELIKQELDKLRKDILQEVDKRLKNSVRP